ncbi:hypothetical protein ACWCZ5_20505, partial [Streptomyces sp. NPDC001667]
MPGSRPTPRPPPAARHGHPAYRSSPPGPRRHHPATGRATTLHRFRRPVAEHGGDVRTHQVGQDRFALGAEE